MSFHGSLRTIPKRAYARPGGAVWKVDLYVNGKWRSTWDEHPESGPMRKAQALDLAARLNRGEVFPIAGIDRIVRATA